MPAAVPVAPAQQLPAPRDPAAAELLVPAGDAMAALEQIVRDPGLLRLVAQPLVDLSSGRAAGYELLARTPGGWAVPPDALFAAARQVGLSGVLHRRTVAEALRLRDSLPADTFLSVNIDPGAFADPGLLPVLFGSGPLSRIVVEVTEHEWPEDGALVDDAIAAIREHGGMIAADDVGAGYAGLNQLMRIRPHFVKIDRELVAGLGQDPAAEALVAAVGQLSGSLDAWMIVEGVETEVQLAALRRLNVPLGQGWLLGRPADPWPQAAATELVGRRNLMNEFADTVWSLLRPESLSCRRDEHGTYRLDGQGVPCLAVAPSTPIRDAVHRALARPPESRWTPLLVTASDGSLIGEVRLEDMVGALAR